MSQIGEAFVRVRPDTTGFRAETTRQVGRDLRGVERQLGSTNREFGRFSRGALVGTGALRELGRAAAFASLSFIGGAGIVVGIKSTIRAAMDAQVVLGQTRNAVARAGLSWETFGEQIQEAALAQANISGFDDERLLQTFSFLVRRTQDVTRSLELNALAADVARGANIELEQAAKLVLRASVGQARGLAVIGIEAKKGGTALELLAQITDKYANSADAFGKTAAGAQARFSVAIQNTQEAIGEALLPTITKYLNKGTEWLNQEENRERIVRGVNEAVKVGTEVLDALTDAMRFARSVGEPLVDMVGGLGNATKFMISFMVASRVRAFATALGLIGPAGVKAAAGLAAANAAAGGAAAGRGGRGRGGAAIGILGLLGMATFNRSEISARSEERFGGGRPLGPSRAVAPVANFPGVFINQYGELVDADGKVRKIDTTGGDTAAAAAVGQKTGAATGLGSLFGSPEQTRDQKTATDLARAQAEGTKEQIVAAAKARLAFIRDTIAFAKKLLDADRGDTAALSATLQKFYADLGATEGIIESIDQAAEDARKERLRINTENALNRAQQAADDYEAWKDARLAEADAIVAGVAKQRGIDVLRKANAEERRATQEAIQDQVVANNLIAAQLIPNVKKRLAAEKTATQVQIDLWRSRAKLYGSQTLAGQQAIGEMRAAKLALLNLSKETSTSTKKSGATGGGFSLQELFAEAGDEFAMYGSNIGGPTSPLSRQDARASFAGTVKTNQTHVTQIFNYPVAASQALNDAKNAAKNLK